MLCSWKQSLGGHQGETVNESSAAAAAHKTLWNYTHSVCVWKFPLCIYAFCVRQSVLREKVRVRVCVPQISGKKQNDSNDKFLWEDWNDVCVWRGGGVWRKQWFMMGKYREAAGGVKPTNIYTPGLAHKHNDHVLFLQISTMKPWNRPKTKTIQIKLRPMMFQKLQVSAL